MGCTSCSLVILPHSRAFAATIPRPFCVRYNAYTQSVEVLDSKEQVIDLTRAIKGEMILAADFIGICKVSEAKDSVGEG